MSYDLAVSEGDRPADDETVGRLFSDLHDRYLNGEEGVVSERIAAYAAALLERWCDITEDEEDTSRWSTGPLISEARGPPIYFPYGGAWPRTHRPTRQDVAESMELVCFDVQQERLRPFGRPSSAEVDGRRRPLDADQQAGGS
ncbi:hypothetical protein ACWGIV_31035 [Streptomyces sp. NPDC054844]